jgi:ferritin-like metal-binding protein YciE
MGASSLGELFEHELGDIYFAEHRLVDAYEEFASNTNDQELAELFEAHREQVGEHIERLVEIFDTMGEPPQEEECLGIEGLLDEYNEFVEEDPDPSALDLYNVTTAGKTQRYEITAYESLIEVAKALENEEAEELLRETLEEERETLEQLQEQGATFDYGSIPT